MVRVGEISSSLSLTVRLHTYTHESDFFSWTFHLWARVWERGRGGCFAMRSSTCEMVLINRQARLRKIERKRERERERLDQRLPQLKQQQCLKEARSVQTPTSRWNSLSLKFYRKKLVLKFEPTKGQLYRDLITVITWSGPPVAQRKNLQVSWTVIVQCRTCWRWVTYLFRTSQMLNHLDN